MTSYQKLKQKIGLLQRDLKLSKMIIADTHRMLNQLDVPNAKSGAHPGHRLFWYQEGKRESFKTSENSEGYHPNVWEEKKRALEEIQKPFVSRGDKEKKKSYSHMFNILNE